MSDVTGHGKIEKGKRDDQFAEYSSLKGTSWLLWCVLCCGRKRCLYVVIKVWLLSELNKGEPSFTAKTISRADFWAGFGGQGRVCRGE